MEILWIIIQCILMILAADFITGIVHFSLDQYGGPDLPIIGKHIYERNARHHDAPRAMVVFSYWKLTWTSWVGGVVLASLAYYFGILNWQIIFMLSYGANANLIHKWSHQTVRENGRLITWLQDKNFFQSRRHHGWHHQSPYDVHYCILTNWLNPVLDKLGFWEGIVSVLLKMGIRPAAQRLAS
ncbi:MAG: fatty acid desaturase CarF family protein [Leadbetterella sp.]